MGQIQRALISVSDKRGLLEFVRELKKLKIDILSTGGTAKLLRQKKVPVTEVSKHTGHPEILDGRVKTLHPKIHGGILAIRSNKKHQKEMKKAKIKPIDLVVVNLYPFEQTIGKPGVSLEEAIENIDIGGPTLIRAAAKNWQDVTVIVEPEDYGTVLEELRRNGGRVSSETNFRLAQKVFALTSRYDGAIANYLAGERERYFPEIFTFQGIKIQDLRYGENPHQRGAFYKDRNIQEPSIANAKQLHGKELSYNNIMDLDGALDAVKEFSEKAVVIVKHATPCGVARSLSAQTSLKQVFIQARDCDPTAAFGGVIAINDRVDDSLAEEIAKDFYECVVAPGFDEKALETLKAKKNIRLLEIENWQRDKGSFGETSLTFRKVTGGFLLQDRDLKKLSIKEAKVVTKRSPSAEEWQALEFAWKVCKHVKSNAIVYARPDRTVGIGGGQVSRVDSAKVGVSKARSSLQGTVMASDAFFPFRDGLDEAVVAGITAVIQPGGALRDTEVIQAADEKNIAMVFTGVRHFRH